MDETDLEQEARRANLREWVRAHGGHAEVVRARHLTAGQASFLSQVMNGYSFGPRAARGMEARLGIPSRSLERRDPPMAQSVSHVPVTMAIKEVTWGQIMEGAPLGDEFKTQMPDDSCGERAPRGHWVVWSTVRQPVFGKLVLARDVHGQLHARVYSQGKAPGEWSGVAVNRAYTDFAGDELTILGVYRGILEP